MKLEVFSGTLKNRTMVRRGPYSNRPEDVSDLHLRRYERTTVNEIVNVNACTRL
jgi:hypothetical protein